MNEKANVRLSVWLGLAGVALVLVGVWQIWAAGAGLVSQHLDIEGLPVLVTSPAGVKPGERPLVLVGHGFAGSASVMRGFAITLARAGYVVAAWDFDGHGGNTRSWQASDLLANAEQVLERVEAQGLADTNRVAILGHSMGSGVALAFGQEHPEAAATIAVSPVDQKVTLQLPHNLLLMAGSLEAPFLSNAQLRLAEAGGAGGDPAQGTGRALVVVPNVEHVSILFAPLTHQTARRWLDQTFGPQPGAEDYRDLRILWYGVAILGFLLLANALAPSAEGNAARPGLAVSAWRLLAALAGGALGAGLLLWLAGRLGLELRSMLGLLVGGYLLVWFGLAGGLGWLAAGFRPGLPSRKALAGGLVAFLALWAGVGWLGHYVWLHWLLAWPRLVWWPLGVVVCLPWFMLVGEGVRRSGWAGRLAWWLGQTLLLVVGLSLALMLNPELSFLNLILPMFPLVLGAQLLGTARQRSSWSFGLSGAAFVSWIVLSVFPLA
ncbi:MAG: alpha/beta fold hydrolase [Chloroflexota bacterium]